MTWQNELKKLVWRAEDEIDEKGYLIFTDVIRRKDVIPFISGLLKEARIDELNRIHHSSEIPLLKYVNNRISELEK